MKVTNLRAKVLGEIKEDLKVAQRENRMKLEEAKEQLRIQNLKQKDENAHLEALANFEERKQKLYKVSEDNKKLRKKSTLPEVHKS